MLIVGTIFLSPRIRRINSPRVRVSRDVQLVSMVTIPILQPERISIVVGITNPINLFSDTMTWPILLHKELSDGWQKDDTYPDLGVVKRALRNGSRLERYFRAIISRSILKLLTRL